jgi:hypothetical protein
MSSRADAPLSKSVLAFAKAIDKALAVEAVPARA